MGKWKRRALAAEKALCRPVMVQAELFTPDGKVVSRQFQLVPRGGSAEMYTTALISSDPYVDRHTARWVLTAQ